MSDSTEAVKGGTLKLVACGRTDTGLKRPHNEDHITVAENLGLFAVADGMGGHAAGEVASHAAIETMCEFIEHAQTDHDFTWPFGFDHKLTNDENILLTAIHLANRRICQMAEENRDLSGMGTTLAALYHSDNKMIVAHVGDSRVYRYRDGDLELLTNDHSWVNEQLQRHIITEDEARNHRWRNVITRALGNRLDLEVDLRRLEITAGDLFLLCSDGLTGMLRDEELHEILGQPGGDLAVVCETLIEAANEAGGLDNISVVLVRVEA